MPSFSTVQPHVYFILPFPYAFLMYQASQVEANNSNDSKFIKKTGGVGIFSPTKAPPGRNRPPNLPIKGPPSDSSTEGGLSSERPCDSPLTALASRYRVVSPRTQRLIGMLPRPSKEDLKKVEEIQEDVKKSSLEVEAPRGLYTTLHRTNRAANEAEEQAGVDEDLVMETTTTTAATRGPPPTATATTTMSPGGKQMRRREDQGGGEVKGSPARHGASRRRAGEKDPWMSWDQGKEVVPSPPETPIEEEEGGEDYYPKFKLGHTTHVQDRIMALKKLLGQLEEVRPQASLPPPV